MSTLWAAGTVSRPVGTRSPAPPTPRRRAMALKLVCLLIAFLALAAACAPPLDGATLHAYAGTGFAGFLGDGGPAVNARLNAPTGLARDGDGNIYIADENNSRVRRVTPAGTISTFAGNGSGGTGGDGGPATAANVLHPRALTVDPDGNVYIATPDTHTIRKVDTSGIITTFAGTGTAGFSGDNGLASEAELHYPVGLAASADGSIYIADGANFRIRRVDPGGTITTVAGNGVSSHSGDGGAATSAGMQSPYGITLDRAGNLYIAVQSDIRVRKVDTSGIITTVAGYGRGGFYGDDGPAVDAWFNGLRGLAIDGRERISLSDGSNNRVRTILANGDIITVVGSGPPGNTGDNGLALDATLKFPTALVYDQIGNLYISDLDNNRVRVARVAAGLTGKAETAGGEPIIGTPVRLYDAASPTARIAYTTTDLWGGYGFEVAPGNYLIEFPGGGTYIPEWWQNQPTSSTATTVAVGAGQQVTVPNAVLAPSP